MANKYDKILGEYREKDLGAHTRFVENGATLELWYYNQLVDSWTVVIPTGRPIGLLLALTYA
jgi:hypothetical protein